MEQYLNDFITYLRDVKRASNNTLQAYGNDLKRFYAFLEQQNITSVIKISETSLNSYVLSLEKEGLSSASVSRNIASMKAFLLYLLKQGKIMGDPAERIRGPKIIKKSPQVMNTSMVNQLLRQPNLRTKKGIRDKAIMELLYATGMKVSELISCKVSDINLTGKYITCHEHNERTIPFGRPAAQALKEYLNIRQVAFDKKKNDYLFLNPSGDSLSRQGLWKILKGYAAGAGLTNINPNMIRQSFAAHLIENGADLNSVKEFLGHSDISSTQFYITRSMKNSRDVYRNSHPRA